MRKKNDFCDFARVELLKERCLGVKQIEQCDSMNMNCHTLKNFMRRDYADNPVTKIIEYLIMKGGVILCPKKNEAFSNGLNQ